MTECGDDRSNCAQTASRTSTDTFATHMIVFPYAKINLGLNVLRKRPDGYHDIESVLMPIPLCDILEAVVDTEVAPGEVLYTRSGAPVPGYVENDLCMKAFRAIAKGRALPGLRMHLHKVIPMGAGLGGGSSDGAHVLSLINELLHLGISTNELSSMAAELGSDCPFFLRNGAQVATGRGDELNSIEVDLAGLWFLLVNPGVHVPTADVYRNTRPNESSESPASIIRLGPAQWQGRLQNTMEAYVLQEFPQIGAVKRQLLEMGATYASMSGSGSTVFGIFKELPRSSNWPHEYRAWQFQC